MKKSKKQVEQWKFLLINSSGECIGMGDDPVEAAIDLADVPLGRFTFEAWHQCGIDEPWTIAGRREIVITQKEVE